MSKIKMLNLYAGIGGNVKNLDRDKYDITSVEIDQSIVHYYEDKFPQDTVIKADAHEYLLEHYKEYDFIWASPPCPTHSGIRKIGNNVDPSNTEQYNEPKYPDMDLYEEIIFLKHIFEGDYVVENVISYYDPLIKPKEISRHYIWSNFSIPDKEFGTSNIRDATIDKLQKKLGYNLDGYSFDQPKRKVLRNCVHPDLGKHIVNSVARETDVNRWFN